MNIKLYNHSIKAVSIVLPKNPYSKEDELKLCNINEKKYQLLQKNSGIYSHFISDKQVYASDLATQALEMLFEKNIICKNELDMIIFTTFTPDFLAPACTSLIHKNLNLSEHTLCFDMLGFCPGFLQSLFQVFLALNHTHIQKVVLICASVKSKAIDTQKDKITFLNNSDSASAILIEKNTNAYEKSFFSQKIFSTQCLEETLPFNGFNHNSNETIQANGNLAFSFAMQNYPVFFQDFFDYFKLDKNKIDEFFIHSSDNFSKQKLLEELKLATKEDAILKNYGNTTINKLPLELASYMGGGINKFSLEALEQALPLMHVA
ncbi:3-oxoacyl-ACP synthase [Campylobacter ornithocola]|uniref:3-oxoacyl-ACP synthase n=1 Tax=Campylobacter ornithocola TaxID=1848766 RepID=UPI000AC2FC88|nr:3-oxoacyl-ACP synthase [Campylobacter ornithocola]QKF57884.1 3-oxoacyl-[acp] synthase III [Campylobacter ornithocola]